MAGKETSGFADALPATVDAIRNLVETTGVWGAALLILAMGSAAGLAWHLGTISKECRGAIREIIRFFEKRRRSEEMIARETGKLTRDATHSSLASGDNAGKVASRAKRHRQ